jgi:hypothetical protein
MLKPKWQKYSEFPFQAGHSLGHFEQLRDQVLSAAELDTQLAGAKLDAAAQLQTNRSRTTAAAGIRTRRAARRRRVEVLDPPGAPGHLPPEALSRSGILHPRNQRFALDGDGVADLQGGEAGDDLTGPRSRTRNSF